MKKKADEKKNAVPKSPWLEGVEGVTGIIPPGRRLSPANERRPTRWSASGVVGVTPPGKQKPGEGAAAESAEKLERKRALKLKEAQKALDAAKKKPGTATKPAAPDRPTAGFVGHAFDDVGDPLDLKSFLEQIAEIFKTVKPGAHALENLGELTMQSRAPYEIAVAFTILSVLVGKDSGLRRKYTPQLERGAKTFFNLAIRLNKNVKAPRGLNPQTMDAIFFDLPATAYQVPYAFATHAFCTLLELMRGDEDCDRALIQHATDLRARYIERRALGDRALKELFRWRVPDWAPEE